MVPNQLVMIVFNTLGLPFMYVFAQFSIVQCELRNFVYVPKILFIDTAIKHLRLELNQTYRIWFGLGCFMSSFGFDLT